MNGQHLRAFLWLRWRLLINQWRRDGKLSAFLMMVVIVGAAVLAIPLMIGVYGAGIYLIPRARPVHLMLAWDVVVFAFLMFWTIGLVTDLQRNDPLSLSKFMHLPVSVNGAFLINYLSSLLKLSMIVFGPIMLGFACALITVKGWALLPVLPLLAAFLLMVTALTYQFQGWLASLMSNPRRRRTMIMVFTLGIVAIAQVPNLINMNVQWGRPRTKPADPLQPRLDALRRDLAARKIDAAKYAREAEEAQAASRRDQEKASREKSERLEAFARLANAVLPPGWLPLGVTSSAEGRLLPALFGLLGMGAIGSLSLWRAYKATLDQFRGAELGRPRRVEARATTSEGAATMMEATLPWASQTVSAIAMGTLRGLQRAPEAKMMLLSSVILIGVFGSLLFQSQKFMPASMRPTLGVGGMIFVMFGMLQLMGNQFGYDRDAFRVFVLSSASRRDILLGKNLAFAPVALTQALLLLVVVQVLCPMRVDQFLTMIPLYVTMFLLFCLFANLFSIYCPIYLAPGALRPASPKVSAVLLQIVMFLVFFPLTQTPVLLPLGVDQLIDLAGWRTIVPVGLLLALGELVGVIFLYRAMLEWEGRLLQGREQRILETVTNRAT